MAIKNSIIFLDEPNLGFRYGQSMIDPRSGLELFGPYDTDIPSHPASIPYGIVGTPEGIASFGEWVRQMNKPIISVNNKNDAYIWPPFPGFTSTFHCLFHSHPSWFLELNEKKVVKAALEKDPDKRAFGVTGLYLDGIKTAAKRDESLQLIICIVPEEVWIHCRPKSRVTEGFGMRISDKERKLRKGGQSHLFDKFNPEQYLYSVDFRRQLKSRSMAFSLPTQIIRQSTLRLTDQHTIDERGLTPLSDRMWNLSTAIYYKAGGKPWRLNSAREGVCYVGISFKKTDPALENRTACCAAQMFLDSGDGIVFMGENGPWYSKRERQCHLTKEAARNLLKGVLETYSQLEGRDLREIFLHYRSKISDEEFAGYMSACPKGTKLVGIRVRIERQGVRLFRKGKMPVVRGTLMRINNKIAYLWASGYKPTMGTYDGWETPAPLRIDIEHGDADIIKVANDIFGLTKLNYNSCKIGDSEPVTIGYSDAVGEILVSNPHTKSPKPNFKYYI